jgi:hypothetical protein
MCRNDTNVLAVYIKPQPPIHTRKSNDCPLIMKQNLYLVLPIPYKYVLLICFQNIFLEMRPQWFVTTNIPFDEMWPDDKYWFPMFLEGQKFSGYFQSFTKNLPVLFTKNINYGPLYDGFTVVHYKQYSHKLQFPFI